MIDYVFCKNMHFKCNVNSAALLMIKQKSFPEVGPYAVFSISFGS